MYRHLLKTWFPLAIASTVIMLTIYAAVQQNVRQSANDPQIQIVEDGATALAGSTTLVALISSAPTGSVRVDMDKSLAPFVIVYDESGKVLASSGYLNGKVPVVPSGVFDYARTNSDDRITWQPSSSVRIAAVVKHFGGATSATSIASSSAASGFIIAGRNMREIEDREGQISLMVGAAWVGLLVLTLIVAVYARLSETKIE